MSDLLPCPNPFDGYYAKGHTLTIFRQPIDAHTLGWMVQCTCSVHGPVMPTEAEAISAWNTRQAAPVEAVDALWDGKAVELTIEHIHKMRLATVAEEWKALCDTAEAALLWKKALESSIVGDAHAYKDYARQANNLNRIAPVSQGADDEA